MWLQFNSLYRQISMGSLEKFRPKCRAAGMLNEINSAKGKWEIFRQAGVSCEKISGIWR
jgi:hypothetical protein